MDIMLCFSNVLIGEGMRCLLSGKVEGTVRVVSDPSSLGDMLKDTDPDILLLDFYVLERYLPGKTGRTKVLLLDTGCSEQQINHALIIKNIIGVIDMNTDVNMFRRAIASVNKGQIWVRRAVVNTLVERLSNLVRICNLTASELNIFKMLGDGLDDGVIARKLGTKEKRIKYQIEALKKKSNVSSRRELIDLSRHFGEFDALTH
ncbi:MAG: response regulator transcription factor [Nitrospirae bacterium]|nr:response regulator transcription factor [Nitrospirota bacterium]